MENTKMAAKRKQKDKSEPTSDAAANELNESRWSVVSFDSREAKNLTYAQAVEKLRELEARKISGLCIVTDEAAERISRKNSQGITG